MENQSRDSKYQDAEAGRVRDLKDNLHPPLQRAVDIASEKGASTWLSILPIEKHGFFLS